MVGAAQSAAVSEARASARVLPLNGARAERKSAPIPSSPTATSELQRTAAIEQQPRAPRPALVESPSETQLPAWLGMGLSMYLLSVEAQYAFFGNVFKWPPLTAALKSQVTLAEMAVAMTTSSTVRANPTG